MNQKAFFSAGKSKKILIHKIEISSQSRFFAPFAFSSFLVESLRTGADLGGGDAPFSGIRPPADPNGPPFELFSDIQFWRTDPKVFRKCLRRQYILISREERAPKKNNFLVKIFQKVPKNAFFQNSKKRLTKFRISPLKKLLDPPLTSITFSLRRLYFR